MASFQARLLSWYRRHRRKLPWRENPEPYRVLVSELMLQQTQVKTVLPYYERFIERFPDVRTLAAASEQDVLAAWSGLGYYRRAKALHRAAKIIVNERGGAFPRDVNGWLELPGVGRYTAGAVVSIALDERAPIVDGNIARVLTRFHGIEADITRSATSRELWRRAEESLPRQAVGDYNQALMELGALVCTKSGPRCLVCPLQPDCVACRESKVHVIPNTGKKAQVRDVTLGAALVERKGRLLLFRRLQPGLMKDLWEFPTWECGEGESPGALLARESRERYGIGLRVGPKGEVARVRHSIMNRRIRLHAFEAILEGSGPVPGEHRWVPERDITSIAVSSMVHKILRARGGVAPPRGPRTKVAPPTTPELS